MTIEACFKLDRGNFRLDVDLQTPSRGVTAIYGPSGCGKTTLLRAFAGLENSCTGILKIDHETWQDQQVNRPPHQRPLGYVFQETALFTHLDVQRNLEYGLRRVPKSERRVSLAKAIKLLGIGHLLERRPDQLSGGEKQRVAIARALAVSPRILLMDEPLSALDQARKQEIMPYLESLHDELEIPVFYVSHSPDEVARLADHLLLMQEGKIIASGPIGHMLTRIDLPLALGDDAEALVEGKVAGFDREYSLTQVDFPGGRFTVSGKELPVGHPVRLRILARDVSLALSENENTSILNIFPAKVEALTSINPSQMIVRLDTGGVPILSRITRKSAEALKLERGKLLYAQVKTVALLS